MLNPVIERRLVVFILGSASVTSDTVLIYQYNLSNPPMAQVFQNYIGSATFGSHKVNGLDSRSYLTLLESTIGLGAKPDILYCWDGNSF